jgi:hypothetical protein
MNYLLYYGWRYVVIGVLCVLAYRAEGPAGVFWALLGIGMAAFVFYAALDGWNALTGAARRGDGGG